MEQDDLVRHALKQVLESPRFAQAPQLSNFLNYVVRKTLAGEAHELKGYTIGVEALGRREDFDPQTDTAVRVLAGRLRKALNNYNREAGEKQLVQISIPIGSYVPDFSFLDDVANDKETSEQITDATPAGHALTTPSAARGNASTLLRSYLLPFAGLLLAAILIRYWASYCKDYDHEPAQETLTFKESQLPSISVSVRATDNSMPVWFSLEETTAGVASAFSKFKDFRIYPVENARQSVAAVDSLADYHFSVLISGAGTSDDLYVSTTLTRQADRSIVWSDNTLLDAGDEAVGIDVPNVAGKIIGPLLSPFGVLNGNIASWKAVPPRLHCINLANAYFSGEDTHAKALHCAQAAVSSGGASSSMHAMLAYLYLEAYQNQLPDVEQDPLAIAGKTAGKAIELDSQNARAHHAMFAVHMTRGHREKGLQSAARAMALNPFDSAIAGTFARYLISIGNLEDAGPALAKAFSMNPSRPARLQIFAYLQAELSANFVEADQLAASIDPDMSPLAAMAVALYGLRNKDSAKTQGAMEALVRMEPDFMADQTTALLRRGFDAGIAETIAARLLAANSDSKSDIFSDGE